MTSHKHAADGKVSKEYKAWQNMKQRCNNPKNPYFRNYGGRGIKVCERWESFENFFIDMGASPPGLTLERRDNSKGYDKDNCLWADWDAQGNNRRDNVKRNYGGKLLTVKQAAKATGVDVKTLKIMHEKLDKFEAAKTRLAEFQVSNINKGN